MGPEVLKVKLLGAPSGVWGGRRGRSLVVWLLINHLECSFNFSDDYRG